MKRRLFTLLTALMFGVASLTQVSASTCQKKAPVHLKKDGTPDKRYKENKPAKGPLKKDGTPDMRYKANKGAAKTKKK